MIRVLHLSEHGVEFESARGAEGLGRALGEAFDVRRRTIGYGGDWRDLPTAAATLRRAAGEFDVIHAWGGEALAVAALATSARIIFSPLPETRAKTVDWLRAVSAYRHVETICPTATLRRRVVERGVPLERCHLIRPGVEFARVKRRRDPELRARLGLVETDHVYLAAGESTRAAGHADAVWATAILHVADPKHKLLVWGRGAMAGSVRRFADKLHQPDTLRIATDHLGPGVEFEELLAAADSVIVPARGPVATLPIAICMAAALPIVSTVTYTVGELLEDRHTALMVPAGKPRQMARRLLDLHEDSSLQWSISDMARTEAYEFFAFTRFVNQFRRAYQQVAAGEPVEVPETAAGAGLRFHGRA